MPKPIAFIKIPIEILSAHGKNINDTLHETTLDIVKLFDNEYYVLIAPTYYDEIEFKVWFDKDFDETNLEEMRSTIYDAVKNIK